MARSEYEDFAISKQYSFKSEKVKLYRQGLFTFFNDTKIDGGAFVRLTEAITGKTPVAAEEYLNDEFINDRIKKA